MKEYTVVIKSYSDKTYEERFEPQQNKRTAESTERGVNINLNHDEYYTIIEVTEDGKVVDMIENEI